RPKSGDQTDDQNQKTLDHGDRRAAEGLADHDRNTRNWSDQCLFQKAELPVPQQPDPRKDRCKQYRHTKDARSDELDVIAVTCPLEYGTETKAENKEVQERLAKRCHDHCSRSYIPL